MAYSYFTKKLLDKSSEIDLNNILLEKVESAKSKLNTNWNLKDLTEWIRDNTNNFKKPNNAFIDLDQAIQRIIYKYYETTNQKNPFKVVEVEEVEYQQPKIPVEVTTSGVKVGKPDVVVEKQPTREDVINVISALEVQAEYDSDNVVLQQVIEGLRVYLDSMN